MTYRHILAAVLVATAALPLSAQGYGTYSISETDPAGDPNIIYTMPWSQSAESSSSSSFNGLYAGTFSSGNAYSSASISSGTLRAYATASLYSSAVTGAGYFETISFSQSVESPPDSFTPITFRYLFDGTLSQGFADVYGVLSVGPQAFQGAHVYFLGSMSDGSIQQAYAHALGFASHSLTQTGATSWEFEGVYNLSNEQSDVVVGSFLETRAGNGGTADYSHTARIGIEVPEGVAYTSASGAFLTGGIPEPHTWALLVLGMGLIGSAMRAHKRAEFTPGR